MVRSKPAAALYNNTQRLSSNRTCVRSALLLLHCRQDLTWPLYCTVQSSTLFPPTEPGGAACTRLTLQHVPRAYAASPPHAAYNGAWGGPARLGHPLTAVLELISTSTRCHHAGSCNMRCVAVSVTASRHPGQCAAPPDSTVEARQEASAQTCERLCGPGAAWLLLASTDKCVTWCDLIMSQSTVHPQKQRRKW